MEWCELVHVLTYDDHDCGVHHVDPVLRCVAFDPEVGPQELLIDLLERSARESLEHLDVVGVSEGQGGCSNWRNAGVSRTGRHLVDDEVVEAPGIQTRLIRK